MLFVLVPFTRENSIVRWGQSSLSVAHVIFPLTLVSILLACKDLAHPVASVTLPLANVQIFVIVVTVAMTFPQILLPLSVVLIVGSLLLVCAVENTSAVTDVSSIDKHFTFVVVTITVSVTGHNSVPCVRRPVTWLIWIAVPVCICEVCWLVLTSIMYALPFVYVTILHVVRLIFVKPIFTSEVVFKLLVKRRSPSSVSFVAGKRLVPIALR